MSFSLVFLCHEFFSTKSFVDHYSMDTHGLIIIVVVVLIATKCLYVCVITLVCWYRKTFKNKHSLDLHRLRFHELGHPGRISESWRSCFYIHSNRMMQYLFRICGDMSVFFWSVVAISFYSIVFENRWCIAILNSMGISHWPQFFFIANH